MLPSCIHHVPFTPFLHPLYIVLYTFCTLYLVHSTLYFAYIYIFIDFFFMHPSCFHCTLYFHSLHSFSSTFTPFLHPLYFILSFSPFFFLYFHSILASIVLCILYPLYFVPCTLYFIPILFFKVFGIE